MKKTILFLTLSFIIISCSSDKSSQTDLSSIVGKWTAFKETNKKTDGTIYSEYLYSEEPCYGMTTYEYKSGGQFVKVSFDYDGLDCVQNPTRTGTWNEDSDNITITVNSVSESSEIISVTADKLILKTLTSDNPNYQYNLIEYSKVN